MIKRMVLWLCLVLLPVVAMAAPEDPAGLEQLRKSAESGDVEAMLELGILYEFGYRLKDHNPPALAWYRLATEAGNAKAGARYEALKSKMSAAEVEEANKLYTEYAATVKKSPSGTPATSGSTSGTPTSASGNSTGGCIHSGSSQVGVLTSFLMRSTRREFAV